MRDFRPDIRGRAAERARLGELLAGVRAGQSAAVVVRGEAGIGKTALLEYVADRARGCRLMRSTGVELEMELPFAALQHICSPLLAGLERLPPPQREALGTAFGLISGPPPDRLFIGLAVLGLLSNAAEQQPLVCLVDDAQWLDQSSAQILSFVGRRINADSVLLVFGLRDRDANERVRRTPGDPAPRTVGRGCPRGCSRCGRSARSMNACATGSSKKPGAIRWRFSRRGIHFRSAASLVDLDSHSSLAPTSNQHTGGGCRSCRRRRRQLLLLAAAEPLGDPALLWRAATAAAIPVESAAPAQSEGLIDFGVRVAFRHPLLRSAVYQAASAGARREAHRRLAEATDPDLDPDRRAWHRAHGTVALDEEVASSSNVSGASEGSGRFRGRWRIPRARLGANA